MDTNYMEQNPEAIFDLITIQSMQDRYGNIESPRMSSADEFVPDEAVFQNETEFETYVNQFPIDDSIAECFAFTSDSEPGGKGTQFVSGGKRPQGSTAYNKLKKRFGWKSADDNLLSEDDTRSRDSKRSKKGGVLSKRHKWRGLTKISPNGSKKSVNFSDQSESENIGDVIDVARRDISRVYQNSVAHDCNLNDSNSVSDSQITSFSDTLTQDEDQTVPLSMVVGSKHTHLHTVAHLEQKTIKLRSSQPHGNVTAIKTDVQDCISSILTGDTSTVIQNMEDISPDEALKLRDDHGNTLLHRCVLIGNADAVKFILEKYPGMTSDMNIENETSVELAAKIGQFDCLKVMLERNQRRKSLGTSLVHRLLNIGAQYGQADCLSLMLSYLSRDPHSTCSLPTDTRGNTAAHLAAKQGHLRCLQTLVASGYDVTAENVMRQRPLHVAHQSRSHTCFEYLLVLTVCEELLRTLMSQSRVQARQQEQITSVRTSMEHARDCLGRYQKLFTETHKSLTESKVDIMETLVQLQNDLELFIKHTRSDSAAKRKEARDKLDELSGEIERLEDTFEFSPMEEMDNALPRLFSSLNDAISASSDITHKGDGMKMNGGGPVTEENIDAFLSSLIKDIHKEFMLENWDTNHVFDKHLSRLMVQNGHIMYASNNEHSSDNPFTNTSSRDGISRTQTHLDQGDSYFETSAIKHAPADEIKTQNENLEATREVIDAALHHVETGNKTTQLTENNVKAHEKQTLIDNASANRQTVHAIKTKNDKTDSNQRDTLSTTTDTVHIHEGVNNRVTYADVQQTERPFTKLLSLDERIDLLISGERAKEKQEDSDTSSETNKETLPDLSGSLYTTTFTSITSDSTSGTSDWFSKLDFTSLETSAEYATDDVTCDVTSGSASYWWDVEEARQRLDDDVIDDNEIIEDEVRRVTTTFGEDVKNQIHLNLGNEEPSFEELRRQRLLNHLRSMQQSRFVSENFRERVTTSSGEVMGGFQTPPTDPGYGRVVVDVNGALKRRQDFRPAPKPRKRGKQRLFTLEDAIDTRQMDASEFHERYERPRDRDMSMRWEDTYFTDEEERGNLPWFEVNNRRLQHWRSDTETSDGSRTPQSYV